MEEDVLAPEILANIISRLRWTDPCSCQGQNKKPDVYVPRSGDVVAPMERYGWTLEILCREI
ncbi:hypothetical protein Bca4012_025332 [Brassica carinata]|uniref:Uncharacterized protein n=1 Tax=Brassica carinata TaxID=52824 RepID=A0A8X7VGG4_BRACI|nr:hypothetical protein Bca52824_022383 [Brassica carinata]